MLIRSHHGSIHHYIGQCARHPLDSRLVVGQDDHRQVLIGISCQMGYHTHLTRYTDQDLTVIVLSNNESAVEGVSGALTYIVMDRSVVRPYEHTAMTLSKGS